MPAVTYVFAFFAFFFFFAMMVTFELSVDPECPQAPAQRESRVAGSSPQTTYVFAFFAFFFFFAMFDPSYV